MLARQGDPRRLRTSELSRAALGRNPKRGIVAQQLGDLPSLDRRVSGRDRPPLDEFAHWYLFFEIYARSYLTEPGSNVGTLECLREIFRRLDRKPLRGAPIRQFREIECHGRI